MTYTRIACRLRLISRRNCRRRGIQRRLGLKARREYLLNACLELLGRGLGGLTLAWCCQASAIDNGCPLPDLTSPDFKRRQPPQVQPSTSPASSTLHPSRSSTSSTFPHPQSCINNERFRKGHLLSPVSCSRGSRSFGSESKRQRPWQDPTRTRRRPSRRCWWSWLACENPTSQQLSVMSTRS